jgi:hypothetical protein
MDLSGFVAHELSVLTIPGERERRETRVANRQRRQGEPFLMGTEGPFHAPLLGSLDIVPKAPGTNPEKPCGFLPRQSKLRPTPIEFLKLHHQDPL